MCSSPEMDVSSPRTLRRERFVITATDLAGTVGAARVDAGWKLSTYRRSKTEHPEGRADRRRTPREKLTGEEGVHQVHE